MVIQVYCHNCEQTHNFSPRDLVQIVYYHQSLILDNDTPLARCLLGLWNEAKNNKEVKEYVRTYGAEPVPARVNF